MPLWNNGLRHYSDIFSGLDELFDVFPLRADSRWRRQLLDKHVELSIDLPGVKLDDVELTVDERSLSLAYTQRGRQHTQVLTVDPEAFDAESTTASLQDGVLTLAVPRREARVRKKVTIKVE